MSNKEKKRRNIAKLVFTQAWSLKKRTLTFSYRLSAVLKLSWMIVRSRIRFIYTKIRGCIFDDKQLLLMRLSQYNERNIALSLRREPNNFTDKNAIQIWASVRDKGSAHLGYLSKSLANHFAPLMDSGMTPIAILNRITGGGNKFYGCNFRFLLI